MKQVVNTAVLNIRSGAGATYPDIGDLKQGDVIEVGGNVVNWWHVVGATRNGQPVLLANGTPITESSNAWCSSLYTIAAPDGKPASFDVQLAVGSKITVRDINGNAIWYQEA